MELDGAGLTCAKVAVLASGTARVSIGSTDRARAAWRAAQELTGPVYGQSTGVGANKDTPSRTPVSACCAVTRAGRGR